MTEQTTLHAGANFLGSTALPTGYLVRRPGSGNHFQESNNTDRLGFAFATAPIKGSSFGA